MALPTEPLGRAGPQITRVGFGSWAIGGAGWAFGWGAQDDVQAVAAMRHAVGRGINWIDLHDPPYSTPHATYGSRPAYGAMVLNFVLLAALYYFLGRKPIAEALVKRRAAVAKEIEEAQRMKTEAEARAKQYQAKLGRLEEELAMAKQALVDAGRGERDRIVRDAEEKASRMQKDATFRIEQEMRQIRQELWRDTVEVAVTAAEDLLKKRITPADQERLAEDYLAELVGTGATAGGAS